MPTGVAPEPRRVALVHDFLLDLRGAERVFLALCGLWPNADVFTAVYDERGTEGRFAGRSIQTSFLQRLRPTARTFRALLPFYPLAVERLDLRGYELVISSSSAWAHGVIVDERTRHVCYCHNPFRYAWSDRAAALSDRSPVARAALAPLLHRWRQWDWLAAQRVDGYVANSETTRQRIARYFGRDAVVVHPPIDMARFRGAGTVAPGGYHLVLSELMGHKRIDVAIAAFNRLRRPLVVAGDGPHARRLTRAAGPTIRFEGRVTDARAEQLLRECRALVVTAREEFGLAAVEAQAAGRPVIAFADGGARETVLDGRTGKLYRSNDPEALAEAVAALDRLAIDPADCVANAERFGLERFERELRAAIARLLGGGRRGEPAGHARSRRRGLVRARS